MWTPFDCTPDELGPGHHVEVGGVVFAVAVAERFLDGRIDEVWGRLYPLGEDRRPRRGRPPKLTLLYRRGVWYCRPVRWPFRAAAKAAKAALKAAT